MPEAPPPAADVHVPDGVPVPDALARTTDLAVGAHPDDLEILVPGIIGACRDDPDRWFTGIVCTDGAGSVAPPDHPELTGEALAARRAEEQRDAADLGCYGALAMLGHPSAEVRTPAGAAALRAELSDLLDLTRPTTVCTHALVDKHSTHLAVALAAIDAVRALPPADRPRRLLGCEAWRGLDWLPDEDKVRLDVSGHEALAAELMACFRSQLGAKRYDLAVAGRRRANATLADPGTADTESEVVVAMDLTPLIADDALDPVEVVSSAIDRFRDEALLALWAARAATT